MFVGVSIFVFVNKTSSAEKKCIIQAYCLSIEYRCYWLNELATETYVHHEYLKEKKKQLIECIVWKAGERHFYIEIKLESYVKMLLI